ncbi:tRNA (adenosine(37)-N6)-threonylcarbamoyltransferase complex ATPase subunit type 1 TsaE [Shewanella oneidensis MR-1]|uniref:tRNA threonylcarbamoyladenosine biosynthesis protein TsaE n=1 Tax=Shewanella oneidensis (strain ATCC 700550 / JCM 31522 / CIP 106686 / LMG 19005 / NCIMB 14063 / MR-1) TaxID=211586 RepID=Q8EJ72_SHEON|nr:tRNA (adenosine(37)-N6)-threonylcarbamoyltransferase complex ATPase subunit type 1 TsaE [Shewanella oneidensis]AAN53677.1 ATPase YjeE [Shewanella oneidensis MR-1]MDX5997473.1 tRNA (adenosine(37)-N6)-threonylcarbamoyltransferase complex ATPase subunit type 1 TsaE [Shewanella oneidensis]MEE2027958.1 tRNA threonylcarbamoyladenosine biosynthesis protein TsaE [Shewanella oneidensis]QKG95493.1 tRNA (adenosine(37)-N6)-threonylcarbamoyltransferase complex ATPase subunit type 1 TsaE [Shewanella oneid
MTELTFQLNNEDETIAVGQTLARHIQAPLTLYLTGDLGAGKTTLSRGLIQGLGHKGAVKSPTYTLVEPYELDGVEVYHFDLYRLNDPEELEFMGIRDYFTDNSLCIVEWPDKGEGLLPDADIHLHLNYVNQGREIHIRALTDSGKTLLAAIK